MSAAEQGCSATIPGTMILLSQELCQHLSNYARHAMEQVEAQSEDRRQAMSELKIFSIYPNERYPDFELHDGELFENGEPCLAMTESDKAEFDAVVAAY